MCFFFIGTLFYIILSLCFLATSLESDALCDRSTATALEKAHPAQHGRD
jgi:hypothetical protein